MAQRHRGIVSSFPLTLRTLNQCFTDMAVDAPEYDQANHYFPFCEGFHQARLRILYPPLNLCPRSDVVSCGYVRVCLCTHLRFSLVYM